ARMARAVGTPVERETAGRSIRVRVDVEYVGEPGGDRRTLENRSRHDSPRNVPTPAVGLERANHELRSILVARAPDVVVEGDLADTTVSLVGERLAERHAGDFRHRIAGI